MAEPTASPAAAPAQPPSSTPGAAPPVAAPARRRKALTAIFIAVLLAGLGWGAWHWFTGRHVETTDNAYVQGNVVQITPQVPGTVVSILADEADPVAAGAPLVRLDDADAKVALARAEAQLAQTVRGLRGTYANSATLQSQIGQRDAELQRATAELARAQADLARRQPLAASGAVGQEEIAHAQAQVTAARSTQAAAQAALATAREALATQQTQTDGLALAEQPAVAEASARVREAYLALRRSTLPAPLAGVVARRNVQIGQRVAAGAPLMTLVALDQLWVDANFKEPQLDRLRIGQPVKLTADVYGRQVVFDGRIAGLGAGTGAAFALLPAQNATGNWIKVVQRVPVRIALDAKQLAAHPLRLGLSMTVAVDVADTSGKTLAEGARSAPVAQTQVFDVITAQADAEVARIIASHGGGARKPAAAPAAKPANSARAPDKTIPDKPTNPATRR
ncbi:MAG TPA: HlyD family efflux transporter periplasmic adaptor subunit [Aquabacterium sp.]|nr:HlyD family efflux transporter periplasmic adaptor subunit [Aquabacterium sp.]